LGHGWTHSLGWRIEERGHNIRIWSATGVWLEIERLEVGQERIGPYGWSLRRESWGYRLDASDGFRRDFSLRLSGSEYALTAVRDLCGNTISLMYDGERLASFVDSAGRQVRLKASSGGQIAAIEIMNAVSRGRWVSVYQYEYDDLGNLLRAIDAEGFAHTHSYDHRHLLTTESDRCGLTFSFIYDRQRRCIEAWGEYLHGDDPSLCGELPPFLADGKTKARGIFHVKLNYFADGYTEAVTSRQGNVTFALACQLAWSFARYRWSANIVGCDELVYPRHGQTIPAANGEVLRRSGLIPLAGSGETQRIDEAPLVGFPGEDDDNHLLRFRLVVLRMLHYLLLVYRERSDGWQTAAQAEFELFLWLQRYVHDAEVATAESRRSHPFCDGRVHLLPEDRLLVTIRLHVAHWPQFFFLPAHSRKPLGASAALPK